MIIKIYIFKQKIIRILEIYNDMKDDDGFLYMKYSSENTFG